MQNILEVHAITPAYTSVEGEAVQVGMVPAPTLCAALLCPGQVHLYTLVGI